MLNPIITKMPDDYDHDYVHWQNSKTGKIHGSGYKDKSGGLGLIKCPKCGRENYAMNVTSGKCCWCPFDMNISLKIK